MELISVYTAISKGVQDQKHQKNPICSWLQCFPIHTFMRIDTEAGIQGSEWKLLGVTNTQKCHFGVPKVQTY